MTSPLVDAYIENAAPFAQPILRKLRKTFHKACPSLEETLKWGVPSFEYRGLLGGMAAFRKHVTWGLWKASLLDDPHGIMHSVASSPMGAGKPTRVAELPAEKHIVTLIRQAMTLNEQGVKLPQRRGNRRLVPKTPADLLAAMKKSSKALATFQSFSPSCRREYIDWVTSAKREDTRARRVATAVLWMSQGKKQNWRYES